MADTAGSSHYWGSPGNCVYLGDLYNANGPYTGSGLLVEMRDGIDMTEFPPLVTDEDAA